MTVAILLLACLVLAVAVGVLAIALREVRERVQTLEASAIASPGSLQDAATEPLVEEERFPRDGLEPGASAPSATNDYVITRLGDEPEAPAPSLEARLFADVVLRESVVKAASWVHGVRSGLSPANRNRIWFEMRREVKRARKDRKAEEREAVREWRARKRAAVRMQAQEESAA